MGELKDTIMKCTVVDHDYRTGRITLSYEPKMLLRKAMPFPGKVDADGVADAEEVVDYEASESEARRKWLTAQRAPHRGDTCEVKLSNSTPSKPASAKPKLKK